MDLTKLKKEIPFKRKIQSTSKYKPQASCVAFIDARDVMGLLDNVCGPENWKDTYKEINGQLFCGISIKIGEEWVTKWDVGSAGNIEKGKTLVSDSFKRAAVKWGVGRFLYSKKPKYVQTNRPRIDGDKSPIYAVNGSNKRIYDLTAYLNAEIKPDEKKDKIEPNAVTPIFLELCDKKDMSDTDKSKFEVYLLNRSQKDTFAEIAGNVFNNFDLYYNDFVAEIL